MTAGVVAVVAYQWTPDTWLQTVAYDSIGLAGVVAMGIGLSVYRPARPLPWWLLLVGQLCYIGGDMVSAVMRRWLGLESRCVVPFTSFSENEMLPDGSRPFPPK